MWVRNGTGATGGLFSGQGRNIWGPLTSCLGVTTGFALGGWFHYSEWPFLVVLRSPGGAGATISSYNQNLYSLYSRMESPDTSSALPHAVTETGLRCGSFSFYFDQTLNFQNMNWFHTTCDPDLPPPTPPLQEENPSPATLPAVPHWRSTRADRRINS